MRVYVDGNGSNDAIGGSRNSRRWDWRSLGWMLLVVGGLCGSAGRAEAQAVTAPTKASFTYTDVQMSLVSGFTVEDFQCASLNAGVCVGQAAQPFQTGASIPKANVTLLATPDSFGNNRQIDLTAAPGNGILASLPAGVPFVSTILGVGDPTVGVIGNSPRSAASNPFFATAGQPAAPGNFKVKP
jgi:hypothetical protein